MIEPFCFTSRSVRRCVSSGVGVILGLDVFLFDLLATSENRCYCKSIDLFVAVFVVLRPQQELCIPTERD
jgi:hypothetical protein